MSNPHDVLIVGAGPAGSSLALHLGRAGIRTLLCDKARFPRLKACGEGLLPHGAAELRALGLGEPPGVRVEGIRYVSPSGFEATGRFSDADLGSGYVVHRETFDPWLLRRALSSSSVEFRATSEGARSTIVVGADGLRSTFHRAPFKRTSPRRRRVGIALRIRGYPIGDTVDVFLGRGGEAYVGPSGPGEASLALLLERGVAMKDFLRSIPALRDVEITRRPIGAGPLGSRVAPIVHGRTLLIGDAAGAVDPVSGEGMSLSLLSARAAAAAIERTLETSDARHLEMYATERRRLVEPAERLSSLLLRLGRHPWLADRAVRGLAKRPETFARLLRAACGAGSIGFLEPARLVL